jgi:hypothetical protein
MKRFRVSHGLVVVALLTSAAPHGLAQTVDRTSKAAAEVLFQDGVRLMKSGDFSEACPKLARSQEIDPAVGTLLYLAECYEKTERPASAWAAYRSAESAALNVGQAPRAEIAKKRADALEPKLPRLQVDVVQPDVAGLEVELDGAALVRASWGVAVPMDPGEYALSARAPGRKPWSGTVVVSSGTEVIEVPALEEAPAPVVVRPKKREPVVGLDTTSSDGSTQRTLGYVVGGVGILGIAAGTVFGLRAKSKREDSKAFCLPEDDTQCYPEGVALHDDAKKAALFANIGFVGGGAAVIGGALLVLLAPSRGEAPEKVGSVRAQPSIDGDSVGITLGGRW